VPSYQLKTRSLSVEVSLGEGRTLSGDIFLHQGSGAHAGDESIADLMNDDDAPFFPLRVTTAGGEMLLVAKHHVHYMLVPPLGADERIAAQRESSVRLDVTLELDDGRELAGALYAELPPGKKRTLDFLNAPGDAFVVLVQKERDCLVNRTKIQILRDTVRLSE
jgi:hypothetical protein